jgi:hypothetical protein
MIPLDLQVEVGHGEHLRGGAGVDSGVQGEDDDADGRGPAEAGRGALGAG